MDQRSPGNDVLISFAKLLHLERPTDGRTRQMTAKTQKYLYDNHNIYIKRTRISLIERIIYDCHLKEKDSSDSIDSCSKNKKLACLMIKRTRISLIERIGCALKRFVRFDRFVFRIIRALCNLIGASGVAPIYIHSPFLFL